MKKVILFFMAFIILYASISSGAFAEELSDSIFLMVGNQNALVHGKVEKVSKENEAIFPFLINNRILVPLRAISNMFDAEITWDDKSKTATVKKGKNIAEVTVGANEIKLNGKTVAMDSEGALIYGSFFLPLRVVAENILGQNVSYIEDKQKNARMIIITDHKANESSLKELSSSAAEQLNRAVDSNKNGLSTDQKYYYINGRAYIVNGFAQKKEDGLCKEPDCPFYNKQVKIPLLSLNWRLVNDPKIFDMVNKDFSSLMQEVPFGNPKKYIYVRKEVADEVRAIMDSIVKAGYPIKSIGAYRLGQQDYISESQAKSNGKEEGLMWAKFHPNGLAIDINWEENPMVYKGSKEFDQEQNERKGLTDPLAIQFHYNNHLVVNTFFKHGWVWGGMWNSSKDYMHFSMGEY